MTDNEKIQFVAYLRGNGGNISDALKTLNIKRKDCARVLESDKDFRDEIHEVIETAKDNVRSSMYREALNGNAQAAKVILEQRSHITTLADPLNLGI